MPCPGLPPAPAGRLGKGATELMTLGPATSESDRLTPVVDDEAALAAAPGKAIEGRSLSRIAWNRLKKDRVAITGAVIIVFLILVALFAPLIVKLLGHPPNEYHGDLLDVNLGGLPKGAWGGASSKYLLGVQPQTGREEAPVADHARGSGRIRDGPDAHPAPAASEAPETTSRRDQVLLRG